MIELITILGAALFKELAPLLGKVIERIAAGQDPFSALDDERIAEVLPERSKLAYAMALERARRGLPPDPDDSTPTT